MKSTWETMMREAGKTQLLGKKERAKKGGSGHSKLGEGKDEGKPL